MASQTRINTRFILILIVSVGVTTMVLGFMYALNLRADAERHIVKGEELLEQGDQDGALKLFLRAVNKKPTHIPYINRSLELLDEMVPTNRTQAEELYRFRIGLLKHYVDAGPDEMDHHLRQMQELVNGARFIQHPDLWTMVLDAANDMLNRVPPEDERYAYGYLYRGMANFHQLSLLSPQQRQDALDDLQKFVDAGFDPDLGWAELITANFKLYWDHKRLVQRSQAEERLRRIDEMIRQADEQLGPDGMGPFMARVHLMRITDDEELEQEERREQIIAAAERYIDELAGTDDLQAVADAASLMKAFGQRDLINLGKSLLKPYIEAHPDRIDFRLLMAGLHVALDELEESRIHVEAVLGLEQLPVSYVSRFQHEMTIQAASQLVDIEIRRFELAAFEAAAQSDAESGAGHLSDLHQAATMEPLQPPAEIRDAIIKDIQAARDRLAALVTDQDSSALVLRADGRLAYTRQDYKTAAEKFEELLKLPGMDQIAENLMHASLALGQIGMFGPALDRAIDATNLSSNNVSMLLIRAGLEAESRQYDDALVTLNKILNKDTGLDPDNVRANEMIVRIRERREWENPELRQDDQFIRFLNEIDALQAAGRTDEARAKIQQGLNDLKQMMAKHEASGESVMANHARNGTVPLLLALVRLEEDAGQHQSALSYYEQAKAISPAHPVVRKLHCDLMVSDPIEKVLCAIEAGGAAPDEQPVAKVIALKNLSRNNTQLADSLETESRPEDAANARDLAARADQRAEQMLAADPAIRNHVAFVEYAWKLALAERNWAVAESHLKTLVAADVDQAGGLLLRGQMLMEKANAAESDSERRALLEQAVREFSQARDRRSYLAAPWRWLGLAYLQLRNLHEARRALDVAWDRNRNDVGTILLYVTVLKQQGDQVKLLNVLRDARVAVPQAQRDLIWHEWLLIESEIGNGALAVRERRNRYYIRPGDRENAIALATVLSQREPIREDVIRSDGKIYDVAEWAALSSEQKQQLLVATKEQWLQESDAIIRKLEQTGEKGIAIALLRANLLKARGRPNLGEEALKKYIEDLPADERDVAMYMTLADFQKNLGLPESAMQTLLDARAVQDSERMEADRALADLQAQRGEYKDALEAYDRILKAAPDDRNVFLRSCDAMTRLGQLDQAESRLEDFVARHGADMSSMLLQVSILEARAKSMGDDSQSRQWEQTIAEIHQILDRAAAENPDAAALPLARARAHLTTYRRTGAESRFSDAMKALDEAARKQADPAAVISLRVDAHMAKNELGAAAGQLRALIAEQPHNIAARRQLVHLYVYNPEPNLGAAIAEVRRALEFNPTNPVWHEDLADLLVMQDAKNKTTQNTNEILKEYSKAYEFSPKPQYLIKLLASMRQIPDWTGMIRLIESDPENLDVAAIRCMYALAIDGTGRNREAQEQLALSYNQVRQEIADGAMQQTMGVWFNAARQIQRGTNRAADLEALVMKLSSGDPLSVDLHELAKEFLLLQPPDFNRAVELQEQAVAQYDGEADRFHSDLLKNLSEYYIRSGNLSAAVQTLERAVEVNPDDASSLNNLAYLLTSELDDPTRALPFAQRAKRLQPADADTLDTLGYVLLKLDRCAEAEDELRRAKDLYNPVRPTCLLHLAQAMICQELPDRARIFVEQGLIAAEKHPELSDPQTIAELQRLLDDISSK